ncbi:hypothetical protein QA811_41050 [Streptomyces sp. B21-102]|uniref:hypothetical protein n=1 Tax=Streptomyces sp. B21-102 TaxID=3039416 RepID=UPI002FEFC39B
MGDGTGPDHAAGRHTEAQGRRAERNAFPARLGDTPQAVGALALNPDGRTLAVGGSSGTLQLRNPRQPLSGPRPTAGGDSASAALGADSSTVYAAGIHYLSTGTSSVRTRWPRGSAIGYTAAVS